VPLGCVCRETSASISGGAALVVQGGLGFGARLGFGLHRRRNRAERPTGLACTRPLERAAVSDQQLQAAQILPQSACRPW